MSKNNFNINFDDLDLDGDINPDGSKSLSEIQELSKQAYDKKVDEMVAMLPQNVRGKAKDGIKAMGGKEYQKAIDICKEISAENPMEEFEVVNVMQIKAYMNILIDDIDNCSDDYNEHLEKLYGFLDGIKLNDVMQYYITDLLENMCNLLENEWFLPRFKTMLKTIEEKNYLKEVMYKDNLTSLHIILESVSFADDKNVGKFVKELFRTTYQYKFIVVQNPYFAGNNESIVDALTFKYYYVKHFKDYESNIEYAKINCPYSYELIKDMVEAAHEDADKAGDSAIEELLEFTAEGTTKEKLEEVLAKSYEYMMNQKDEPNIVYAGEGSYKRSKVKIGRNDPCPCGSGKKYKNCCGK